MEYFNEHALDFNANVLREIADHLARIAKYAPKEADQDTKSLFEQTAAGLALIANMAYEG